MFFLSLEWALCSVQSKVHKGKPPIEYDTDSKVFELEPWDRT